MKQINPRTPPAALAACQQAAKGVGELSTELNLLHNTQVAINGDINAYLQARDAFNAGKVTLNGKRATVRSVTLTGRGFLKLARNVLTVRLGDKHSEAWNATGFVGSLALPRSAAAVQVCLQAVQRYLAANQDLQVQAGDVNVSSARAESLFDNLTTARAEVSAQVTTVGNLLDTRNAAVEQLRDRLRWLAEELGRLIGPLDRRWKTFGLNMPGADNVPGVPQNVLAVLIGPTAVSVKWEAAARAEHYRVWKKVIGVDEEFVHVGSPADLDFTMEALPNNATIAIAVSAVNNGGETALSTVVTVQTH
jgi:hypothetical protein